VSPHPGLRAAGVLLVAALSVCAAVAGATGAEQAAAAPSATLPASPTAEAVPVHAISPSGVLAYEVTLAVLPGSLALAWHGEASARSALWLRFADARGAPISEPLQLTDGQRDAYEPDLQAFAGGLALAWYEKDAATGSLGAWVARLDGHGQELWRQRLSRDGRRGRNPVVRVAGQNLWVAWIETDDGQQPEVLVERFAASGQPLLTARPVAAASSTTWNLNAAVDDSGALHVVYDAALATRANELQWLRIDATGRSHQRRLSADDGAASAYPDIGIAHGRVAITWFDRRDGNDEVYLYVDSLRRLRADGDALHVDGRAQRVTHGSGASIGAYLTWNRARIGLSWQDEVGGMTGAFVARFDSSGRMLGAPLRLDAGAARALIPAIRPWRRGFAVAWNDFLPGEGGPHAPPRSSIAEVAFVE
jgi:hypothetical protein